MGINDEVDWSGLKDIVVGIACLVGLIWGGIWLYGQGEIAYREYRHKSALQGFLRRAIAPRRNATVDQCKAVDGLRGYCFVNSLNDDGSTAVLAIPVKASEPDALDIDRFLEETGAKKGNQPALTDALLDYLGTHLPATTLKALQ